MSGQTGYHAGRAGEDSVAAAYEQANMQVVARRWRGKGGEIDLIAKDGDQIIFVEVKKSKDFARAAQRLGRRQMDRIVQAGSEFLAHEPLGQLTDVRFDLALVNDRGQVKVVQNAFCEGW